MRTDYINEIVLTRRLSTLFVSVAQFLLMISMTGTTLMVFCRISNCGIWNIMSVLEIF